MTPHPPHVLREAVKATLRDLARLEGMTVYYINRGKAGVGSPELTRSEFLARFTEELTVIRTQLKETLTSMALTSNS